MTGDPNHIPIGTHHRIEVPDGWDVKLTTGHPWTRNYKMVAPTAPNVLDRVIYLTTNTVPTAPPPEGVDTTVLSNGTRYEWDGTIWRVVLTCPAPMTRAALVALRTAGTLNTACHYTITDHVQGRLVAGTTITLHAVSANELSERVEVNTTYDNEAWAGIYDIDRALVLELADNRGNVAKGFNGVEVSNFDWGNTSYTNVVVDNATLTANIGNTAPKANVNVTMGATLNLTNFAGSINNFDVDRISTANFTGSNGTWRLGRVSEGSLLNCLNYQGAGDNYYFEVMAGSNINFSGRTSVVIMQNSKLHGMSVQAANVATGLINIRDCGLLLNSTIQQSVGAGAINLTRVQMEASSTINNASLTGGIMNISNTRIAYSGQVIKANEGTLILSQSEIIQGSAVSHSGTGTLNVNWCEVSMGSTVGTDAGTTISPSFSYVRVEQASALRCLGAVVTGTFSMTYSRIASQSFIYKRASHAGNLALTRVEVLGSSGMDFSSGNRSCNVTNMDMNEAARATFTGTGAVTDTLISLEITTQASLQIASSGAAITILYSQISGLSGGIAFTGTSGDQRLDRVKCHDGGISFINSPANANLTLCSMRDAGRMIIQNLTVARSIQYCDVENAATMNVTAPTVTGTLTNIKLFGGAAYNVSGAAATANGVVVMRGGLQHNGGTLQNITKGGSGSLTTGNFNHTNVVYINDANFTMAAANTNRARYTGLGIAAYAPTGQVI